ncbi:hypothetical protein STCU_00076 [Strigomonas culicis]|uniref:Dynamin N-terminal domain-containing protein n=1 Tax=Strigomonas culicis TaxID=28005 RepID=S9WDL3_9TRYP|nr:hypothetical protein STCU_00076 [Strigomonas culicis]|eukprot:EPY37221.1 hypothetical protein STCU_00076 [Strigomonas culicis]
MLRRNVRPCWARVTGVATISARLSSTLALHPVRRLAVPSAAAHAACTMEARRFFAPSPPWRKATGPVAGEAQPAPETHTQAAPPRAAEQPDEVPEEVATAKSSVQRAIEEELERLKSTDLRPHDKEFCFISELTYSVPMVLMLGNHSSGKSTLINYLVGREVQETGVAPTDDGFTIIQRSAFDMDDDGPSAAGNPNYQFKALKRFGSTFVNRFRVKSRTLSPGSKMPYDMMLVDSPGMIDTPVHVTDRTSAAGQLRGYDFLAATRWFAQRSDVILLMFDPANPGTTGETLDVLTKSLSGCEHKFLLVLNKIDVFEKVTDFARAYASLCWNLSKVIQLKDMPRIYTTCTPRNTLGDAAGSDGSSPIIPSGEIERQRVQILDEIFSAPLRRLDNLITETEEGTEALLMAAQVCNVLRRRYRERKVALLSGMAAACVAVPAFIVALSGVSLSASVGLALLSALGGYSLFLMSQYNLREYSNNLLSMCDSVVRDIYAKDYTNEVELRWRNVVRPQIMHIALSRLAEGRGDVRDLPTTSKRVVRRLQSVLRTDLPALRMKVAEYKQSQYQTRFVE